MKNTLMIDMDTDREDVIRLSKPESLAKEVDDSETARLMVLDDLTTVCNGLGSLIHLADANKYMDTKTSTRMVIEFLTDNFGGGGEGEPDSETESPKDDK